MAEVLEVFRNEHYSRGMKLYDSGLYEEAILEFESVVHSDRRSPEGRLANFFLGEAYANLGKVHLKMNMLGRAEQELEYALALQPDYPDLHLNLAIVRYRLERFESAESGVRDALSLNPRYTKAIMYLGLCMLRRGCQNGLAEIAAAVSQQPAYDEDRYSEALSLYRDGDREGALKAIESLAETDLDHVGGLIEQGMDLIAARKYAQAARILKDVVEICPHYADVRHNLGVCYLRLNHFDLAVEEFRSAVEINPSFLKAHVGLASAYRKTGFRSGEMTELEHVIRLDPRNAAARRRQAELRQD